MSERCGGFSSYRPPYSGIHKVPQRPRFYSAPSDTTNRPTQSPLLHHFQTIKMAHANSFNTTNSYNNVWNNCTIPDEQSQVLTWLSPLEPKLRHHGIQDRRVEDVGEWLLQTEAFRNWCTGRGRCEPDDAVLFCYGNPGVGKTYIW